MPLPRHNHNPVWQVVDRDGRRARVFACDETQAERYAREVLRLAVVEVVLEGRAQDDD